jgi:tetratricopeptide (TPR) repeat protein
MGGRFDEFIGWARHRLARDPLDTDTMWELAGNQARDMRLVESVATYRRLLELNPAYAFGWGNYGATLLYMGRNVEALAMAQKETDSAYKLVVLAATYWSLNRRSDSDLALAALERGYADRSQYQIAAVHAYRGEVDSAFTWLDRACQQNRGSLEYLKVEPPFRNLQGDPRFDALLRKVKLVE